jgi:hypothetical protein
VEMRTLVFYLYPNIEERVDLNAPHNEYLPVDRTVSTFVHDVFHGGFDVMLTHSLDKNGEDIQLLMIDDKGRKFRQR